MTQKYLTMHKDLITYTPLPRAMSSLVTDRFCVIVGDVVEAIKWSILPDLLSENLFKDEIFAGKTTQIFRLYIIQALCLYYIRSFRYECISAYPPIRLSAYPPILQMFILFADDNIIPPMDVHLEGGLSINIRYMLRPICLPSVNSSGKNFMLKTKRQFEWNVNSYRAITAELTISVGAKDCWDCSEETLQLNDCLRWLY
uniref:Uncharacterized protein n=1 Tax=Glossina austeni TaxID=7395 RepID=A0A1A9UV07_GLOAU